MSSSTKRSRSDDSGDEYSASVSPAPPKKRVSKAKASTENKENDASGTGGNILTLKKAELDQASKAELVGYVLALQKLLGSGGKGAAVLSPAQVAEKVEVAKKNMIKNIKSQMKWKPSCKDGSARWSYSATVPNDTVFKTLFELPDTLKAKQTKIDREAFGDLTDNNIQGSVRYDTLHITGKQVNLKWNSEDNEFTVSGSYGKSY